MLVGVPVDRVPQQVGSDPAVVEQCVSLTGRAVAHHRLAVRGSVEQEAQELGAHAVYRSGETRVALHGGQPCCLLTLEHLGDRYRGCARGLGRLGPEPDGASVGGQQLDVDKRQAAGRQPSLGRAHRVVLEVLMVDRVELGVLDQGKEVLDLD